MNQSVQIRLTVESGGESVEGTCDFTDTKQAVSHIVAFLLSFAVPDAGPQTIEIKLISTI